jgi:DNA modification methylase
VCTSGASDTLLDMHIALEQATYFSPHVLVWVKNKFVLSRLDYHPQHELIIYGWVEGAHRFYGGRTQVSTWEIDKPTKSDLHLTMKPVELYRRAIQNSSQPGDIVCDPFGGSGPCLVVCEELHRRARVIEIDSAYVAVILERWHQMTHATPVLVEETGCPVEPPDTLCEATLGVPDDSMTLEVS